jgi:hypothetical protein
MQQRQLAKKLNEALKSASQSGAAVSAISRFAIEALVNHGHYRAP